MFLKEEGLVYFFVTVDTLRLIFLEDFLVENTINWAPIKLNKNHRGCPLTHFIE